MILYKVNDDNTLQEIEGIGMEAYEPIIKRWQVGNHIFTLPVINSPYQTLNNIQSLLLEQLLPQDEFRWELDGLLIKVVENDPIEI